MLWLSIERCGEINIGMALVAINSMGHDWDWRRGWMIIDNLGFALSVGDVKEGPTAERLQRQTIHGVYEALPRGRCLLIERLAGVSPGNEKRNLQTRAKVPWNRP